MDLRKLSENSCKVDTMEILGAKLVEKHTFLQLEPEQLTAEEIGAGHGRRSRALSDTLICYDATVPEERSQRPSSRSRNAIATSDSLLAEQRGGSRCSSQSMDTEDEGTTPVSTWVGFSKAAPPISRCLSPAGEQLYYYFPLPGSPLWGRGAGQNSTAAPVLGTPALPSSALEFQATELRSAAAQLEAAARHLTTTTQAEDCNPLNNADPLRPDEFTTVMLRNIPNDYTREMLLELLDEEGFAESYDFVYLPIDFSRMAALGYAFVNFVSHSHAELAKHRLQGYSDWKISSQKVCDVCWGEPLQGQAAHIERYRSSPVMHNDVPDHFKPLIFKGGVRVRFPGPTKRIRPPRSKRA